MLTPEGVVGLLADPVRLRVLAAVALGTPSTDLPAVAGVPPRAAAAALHRLQAGGLVVDGQIDLERLRALAAQARPEPESPLEPFVRGRTLRSLPAQPERRRTVLAHIAARSFRTGVDYDEQEVNALLGSWCEGGTVDHAALRRYLVESGLMSRGAGVYRLGGAAVVPDAGEELVRSMGLS